MIRQTWRPLSSERRRERQPVGEQRQEHFAEVALVGEPRRRSCDGAAVEAAISSSSARLRNNDQWHHIRIVNSTTCLSARNAIAGAPETAGSGS